MYLRVPIRTSMNSSVVMSSRIMTSQLCSLSTELVECCTGALVGMGVQLASIRRMVFSSVLVSLTVAVKVIYMSTISTQGVERDDRAHTPPVVFFLNTTSGRCLFNLMPTASSSISNSRLCSSLFVASNITQIKSAVFAVLTTCLPRPLP